MKENTAISPVTQRNIDTIHAWLDAHNRQDMRAIDCYTEDIEIVEVPTGVVYKGMDKMRELARMAYRRKARKDLTQIIATDTAACVEYIARADMSEPLAKEERESGIHGVNLSKAKTGTASVAMPVCFICHFTEEGKIDRVREYWDVATLTRQFGIEGIKSKILRFFLRLFMR
jgi:ketosteroid isomerase-like protein